MSNYRKGANLEYKLASRLWEEGFAVNRQAGSGSVNHASSDVIAVKNGLVYIFEVKNHDEFPIDVSKDKKQLTELRRRAFGPPTLHSDGRESDCFFLFKKHGMMHIAPYTVDTIDEDTKCAPLFKLLKEDIGDIWQDAST